MYDKNSQKIRVREPPHQFWVHQFVLNDESLTAKIGGFKKKIKTQAESSIYVRKENWM